MTWSETWCQAQRRRGSHSLIAAIAVLAMVIGMLALSGLAALVAARIRVDSDRAVILAIFAGAGGLFLLVPLLVLAKHYRTERAILRLVPTHDGLICPRCRRALEAMRCRCCSTNHVAQTVRDYWEQYPYGPSERQRPGRRVVMAVVVAAVAVFGLWLVLMRGSPVVALVRCAPFLVAVAGIMLLRHSIRRRADNSRYCGKCGYERVGEAGPRCSECGSDWTQPGGLVRGGRAGLASAVMWMGVALVLAYVAVPLVKTVMGDRLVRSMTPTWYVFEQVEANQRRGAGSGELWGELAARPLDAARREKLVELLVAEILAAPRGSGSTEWNAVRSFSMTADQELRLFEGLVQKQDRLGQLSLDDRRWLAEMIEAGTIPDELAKRYDGGQTPANDQPPPPSGGVNGG